MRRNPKTIYAENYVGTSADVKNSTNVPAGSRFTESDTGCIFIWDGYNWQLIQAPTGRSGLLVTAPDIVQLLATLIQEQRTTNLLLVRLAEPYSADTSIPITEPSQGVS